MVSTVHRQRVHMHYGCWVAPCSVDPDRIMVAFPKEFEGSSIVQKSGTFALSFESRQQRQLHERFFAGDNTIEKLGVEHLLRAPGGSPITKDAVAYCDCRVFSTYDLGDFLLVIGDVVTAQTLNRRSVNLTVNDIIETNDPRGTLEPKLPYEGFDFDTDLLPPAPVDPVGTPGTSFSDVYWQRQWGLFFVSAAKQGRGHFHVGSWAMQTSHEPPRMAVCFEQKWEVSDWLAEGLPFAMSLISIDDINLARTIAKGEQSLQQVPIGTLTRTEYGLHILNGGLAYFICKPEAMHAVGRTWLVIAEVEKYGWLNRDSVNLRIQDLASSADNVTTW